MKNAIENRKGYWYQDMEDMISREFNVIHEGPAWWGPKGENFEKFELKLPK